MGSQLIVLNLAGIRIRKSRVCCDKIVGPRNSILNKLLHFSALPFASGSVLLRVLNG